MMHFPSEKAFKGLNPYNTGMQIKNVLQQKGRFIYPGASFQTTVR